MYSVNYTFICPAYRLVESQDFIQPNRTLLSLVLYVWNNDVRIARFHSLEALVCRIGILRGVYVLCRGVSQSRYASNEKRL